MIVNGPIDVCELIVGTVVLSKTMSNNKAPYTVKLLQMGQGKVKAIRDLAWLEPFNKLATTIILRNHDFAVVNSKSIYGFTKQGDNKWQIMLPNHITLNIFGWPRTAKWKDFNNSGAPR